MMSIQEILDKISSISNDNQEYVVFEDDTNKCYFGKDKTGHIAFLIESSSPNISPLCRKQNLLVLFLISAVSWSVMVNVKEK